MTESDILKLQQQDKFCQEKAYKLYSGRIYKLVLRYTNHEPDAADIVNRTFHQCFRQIRQFEWRGENSFEVWLRRISINEALQFLRKRKIKWIELDHIDIPDAIEVIEFQSINAEELHKVIRQLPDGYRAVFNLYVVEEYSHSEIGKMLGISESSSRSQLTRARAILKAKLLNKIKSNKDGIV